MHSFCMSGSREVATVVWTSVKSVPSSDLGEHMILGASAKAPCSDNVLLKSILCMQNCNACHS
jgi:hypothetical protein